MGSLPRVQRTADGPRAVVDRVVAAAPGAVWRVLTDTERWPAWGPSVSAVRCADRYVEAGTNGAVQVGGGPWVPFEVDTCADRRWTWRVAGIPATGHRVEPAPGGGARVAFELPLFAGGSAVVRRMALTRIESLVQRDA